MANGFCHLELSTQDLGAAKSFYTQMFDWKLNDADAGGMPYTMIDTGEQPGGGMMSSPAPGMPSAWLVYVLVDDVDAAVAKATELGGQVIVGKTPIPQMGAFAVLTDPTGAAIGVWESAHA